MADIRNVIIIGSGPAALTAALYNARANLSPLVLAGVKWGGQLMLTTDVENYPGFPKGILGPELMKLFRDQATRFGAEIMDDDVGAVDFKNKQSFSTNKQSFSTNKQSFSTNKQSFSTNKQSLRSSSASWRTAGLKPFLVKTAKSEYQARSVIIATGAETNWLGLANEQKLIGRGVSSCAPCDAFFFKDKKVVVVGGGDSAMEEALTLTKFATDVTIIHRRNDFRASKIMLDRARANKKINWIINSEVVDVLGTDKVESVKIKNTKDGSVKDMPIDGMFVAIGHHPVTEFLKGQVELDEKGFVVKKKIGEGPGSYKMATSVEGVFVAGDVHDYHYRQAVTAAGYGCAAALETEKWLEAQV